MTRRGRLALALGVTTYIAAWAFGSRPLYPVAIGLLLAAGLAWIAVRLAARPVGFRRSAGAGEHLEGDDVAVELELEPEGWLGLTSASVVERVNRLGTRRTPLRREGRFLRARYTLPSVPRGRYAVEEAQVVLEDPFGLERAVVPVSSAGALVVYPRLVELDVLFSESGTFAQDGRKLLLRRPSGFDLHSVREAQEGESLRKVHWKSTARRGRLMVKELEDAPRDEVAVLLDGDARAVAEDGGESSFDVQVRAAGSLVRAHAVRGRRAVLIVNSALREVQRVRALAGDWRSALELLAAAEPTATTPVAALLAEEATPAARALELAVVTARLEASLVDRLMQRALGHRRVSVVYVDAPSFAGRTRPTREPGLLRLQGAGVAVAVVRRGDDLREKLGGARVLEAAHG